MKMDSKSVIGKRRNTARKGARESYEVRRKQISDAAVSVFHRLGYQGASLSAVANELGVDRATLYYYFSSKEQMYDEIVRTVLKENEKLALQIAESSIAPARKMREIVTAFMESYIDNYPLLHIYVSEDLRHVSGKRSDWSLEMLNINKRIEGVFIQIIEEGYEDGSFRNIGPAQTVAYGVLGMLNWSHRWFKPDAKRRTGEIGTTFAELVLGGLEAHY
jgi:AcrR family transcriptional regulator